MANRGAGRRRGERGGRGPIADRPHSSGQGQPVGPKWAAESGRIEHPVSGEDAFARFYRATAAAIRAYILRHCSDRDSADDLLQTTYVKFLGSRMADTPQAPQARAYLYRIASNVIADHGRTLQRRQRFERPKREFTEAASAVRFADDIALRDALATLSKREQQMLWLLYGEGFAHAEVARIMNLGRASVRVLAFRARKKLKVRLAERRPTGSEAGEGQQ